jgi:hypothetical protein
MYTFTLTGSRADGEPFRNAIAVSHRLLRKKCAANYFKILTLCNIFGAAKSVQVPLQNEKLSTDLCMIVVGLCLDRPV